MRLVRVTVSLVLVVSSFAGIGNAAVADYLGKPVASIRLIVEGHEVADTTLTDVLETRVGRPLSMADVRESVTHLFSLGRFEDVRVDATLDGNNGIALRYDLNPVHPVTAIEFEGRTNASGIDEGALRRALNDRFGRSPALGRADEIARVIEDQLRERGYLKAVATPRASIAHDPERATLIFTIEPGARAEVGSVNIVGAAPAERAVLLERLRLTPGAPYEQDALITRIDQYIEEQRRRGYYEATVTPAVKLSESDRIANITLTVASGPHVRVVFAGDALPADKRTELVPVEREGSVDEDLLEDSTNRIEDYLRAQGYRDARAPHTRQQSDGELLITFDVNKGPEYRVERVEISGNAAVSLSEFEAAFRLRADQPFSNAKLSADVASIGDFYRRRGFAGAKAQSAVEPVTSPTEAATVPVVVRLVIAEGVRTVVSSIHVQGNVAVPEAALLEGLGLRPGEPFFATQMAVDRDQIQSRYANLGYQTVSVGANPGLSQDGTRADVAFTVREGLQVRVEHVLIVGNVRTKPEVIRRELQLKPGDPLGVAAVIESRRRLAELGLFRRVNITELRHGAEATRDLLVTVEEAPATTLTYGAGGEVRLIVTSEEETGAATQRLEFAPRASFSIGRRNLFGKNRSINLFTGVALHPEDSPAQGTTEYQVVETYREPRVFGTPFDAFVRGVQEQQIRSSYSFTRRQLSADVTRHLTPSVFVTGDYRIESTTVFNTHVAPADQLLIDRLFPQVRLSSFLSSVVFDTRDDPVDPRRGEYFSVNGQLAARAIGSEVGFVKSFFTASMFRQVSSTSHIVFAGDARLGLAHGFPRIVPGTDSQGNPILDINGRPVLTEIEELPQSERFFAGGDTTVRGFALDTLGTPATIDKNGFPIGGNGVVLFNAELRVPVGRGVGFVGFLDTGNVFAQVSDIYLGDLRSSAGFGVRYKSPVGPIRIDLGFKLRREVVAGQLERLTALHISFGEAF
jgi:outer membrane protein assembly complex protein YaeT